MKGALLTATAALALAAAPATAQIVGGEAEVDTDTQVETSFANDGAETRTGVATEVKADADNEMADWAEDTDDPLARQDVSERNDSLDGAPKADGERTVASNAGVDGLSEYELNQLQKVGAADQIDTLSADDLTY